MQSVPFPEYEVKNQAVQLQSHAEQVVRSRHPWVFDQSITKISEDAKAGDRAIIFDRKKNRFLGLGLIDPTSIIRIKMLFAVKKENFDESWIIEKLKDAFHIRKPLLETNTNSYRWIYGENDGLPGLIIDVYNDVVVLKLYSTIWLPYLKWISNGIMKVLELEKRSYSTLVLRLSRSVQKEKNQLKGLQEGQVLAGTLASETVIFIEHGIKFSANVIHGHKTGYFLDHRLNRKRVGELASAKTVLDVFSYAGGFSVHALCGGAKEVVSVDISKQALTLAEENAALNGDFKQKHTCIDGDAFKVMSELIKERKTFDLVVVDPPSFAKRASEIELAKKTYRRLTKLAISLAEKKGILVLASCSSRISTDDFHEIISRCLNQQPRHFEILEEKHHDIDHPVTFDEGKYLKCFYIQMD